MRYLESAVWTAGDLRKWLDVHAPAGDVEKENMTLWIEADYHNPAQPVRAVSRDHVQIDHHGTNEDAITLSVNPPRKKQFHETLS